MKTVKPRQDFLASTTAIEFAESVATPSFIAGVRAALLEFIVDEPRGNGWEDSARSRHYIEGAKDFAQYLLTFTDSTPDKPQSKSENLQWPTRQSVLQRQPKPGSK